MLLALFRTAGADQRRPQVRQQGVLMRYASPRLGCGGEVDGVRLVGREEKGRVRARRRGVPGVVWDGLAELDVLTGSGRCEFCWDLC